MERLTAALLLAGCMTLQMWAQRQEGQNRPEQAPAAEQKPDQQKPGPSAAPENPAAAPVETEFFLDKFQGFSAIQNGATIPGHDFDGYIYRSGKMMRMQGNAGIPQYFVTDLQTQTTHGITHNGCIKLRMLYPRNFPFFLSGPGFTYQRVPAGEETVDGHVCRVEDVTINAPKHPPMKLRFWEAEDLQGFPVMIKNNDPGRPFVWVIRYKDVVLGPQDPTLFIVPDRCQNGDAIGGGKASPGPTPKKAPAGKPQ